MVIMSIIKVDLWHIALQWKNSYLHHHDSIPNNIYFDKKWIYFQGRESNIIGPRGYVMEREKIFIATNEWQAFITLLVLFLIVDISFVYNGMYHSSQLY